MEAFLKRRIMIGKGYINFNAYPGTWKKDTSKIAPEEHPIFSN